MTVTVPDVLVRGLYHVPVCPDLYCSSTDWKVDVIAYELSLPNPTVSAELEHAPNSNAQPNTNAFILALP